MVGGVWCLRMIEAVSGVVGMAAMLDDGGCGSGWRQSSLGLAVAVAVLAMCATSDGWLR